MQMQYYQYLIEYIDTRSESGIISPSVMGVTDPVLVRLVEEFAALQQRKKLMAFTMSENQPQLELIDQNIEASRKALRDNISSAISQLKMSINTLDSRIKMVETGDGNACQELNDG